MSKGDAPKVPEWTRTGDNAITWMVSSKQKNTEISDLK